MEVCAGTAGGGTVPQARRLQVQFLMGSLGFFVDFILPATLWSWGQLRLQQKRVPGISWGIKAAGA